MIYIVAIISLILLVLFVSPLKLFIGGIILLFVPGSEVVIGIIKLI